MCVPYNASPPGLAPDVPRPEGSRMQLTSADGTTFAAYHAAASEPTGAAVVLLPDIRGLFAFYEQLARNLAASGVDALAFDYFGRTAGTDPRPADWDFWPHVEQTTAEQVGQDVEATLIALRQASSADRFYTVGFCFGGGQSFAQAYAGFGLDGVVGFYGFPKARRPNFPAPIEHVDDMDCRVLGLFGGADEGIPVEVVQEFDHALDGASVDHEIHVYPGAPHSFFDRAYENFADECEDSWHRLLTFMAA